MPAILGRGPRSVNVKILDSPETAEATEHDGVKRDTVKGFVLDRRFDP